MVTRPRKAICTMASFYYYDLNPFRFNFHIKIRSSLRGLNNKSPNLHKKTKSWRILVVVVKWRHRANGLFSDILTISVVVNSFLSCHQSAFSACKNGNSIYEIFYGCIFSSVFIHVCDIIKCLRIVGKRWIYLTFIYTGRDLSTFLK